MKITLDRAVILLPFVFMLHNIEEILGMQRWESPVTLPLHVAITPWQFAIAAMLFTVLGFIIVFSKRYYNSEKQFPFIITGFSGVVFLNVFFPHLIVAILFKQYVPGVITALFFNLPLSGYILFSMFKTNKLNLKEIIGSSVIGALIGFVLLFIFFSIGAFLLKSV